MMSFRESKTESMAPDTRRSGVVVGLRKTTTSEVYDLTSNKRRWVVGSGPSCDVSIEDPFVSAIHCLIERKPGGSLVVRDRESRNGTFVDGNAIEAAELRVGSYISVGRTTLVAVGATGGERPRALELMRGHDPAMRMTIEQALRAAQGDCNVLIVGETGTGKDLLARVVHEASRRASAPFVPVNCGAIPRELIASELFGHEKGAFTGAHETRDGYFVEAGNGTLFLDEIGELPIELQPNLLRALESKRVRRVGGSADRPVDARIIAATNRVDGLGTESSRLRLDLYHRLATVVLSLPPLRERMTDVTELVQSMLDELEVEHGRRTVTDEAWRALTTYSWPGNVRELRHAVARAVALGGDELATLDFFPDHGFGRQRTHGTPAPELASLAPYEAMIRSAMETALQAHGSIRSAAASIGMPKSTFSDRARAWGLAPKRKPRLRLFKR
ncbi:MAG: Sigma 54 interacting domain protein [Myxococcales bacterium]|nr:Sigma 54 interacting domain protein [Myxococcales bacterium]